MQPIFRCVEAWAKTSPDSIAVITGDLETTYRELWEQIQIASAWYHHNGVEAADRVIISADSRDQFYTAAYLGVHHARAIAVPTSFRASDDMIELRKKYVASKLDLFGDNLAELRRTLASPPTKMRSKPFPSTPELSDVAEIMFTTGSTGKPKAVTLTHANIAASAELIRRFVGNGENDIEVVTIPLTHSFGLGRLRSTFLAGGTIVLVPGLTFPQLTIRALHERCATGLACVPAGMALLLSNCEEALRELAGQLKYLELGSAPMPLSSKIKLREILPHTRLCMHYGLTEASRSTFLEFHSDRNHLDSVGKPSPGVEIAIMGETRRPMKIGRTGLIHVRAPTVMRGYWNDRDRSKQVLDHESGWLNTGDLGCLDADGYVHLIGRADDVINTGGVNVVPDEIESLAKDIVDVEDCGCVGVPDPDGILGEIPLLFVTSGNKELDLGEISRNLVDQLGVEVPRILVKLTSKLLRSNSGKLLRQELRMMYENEQSETET